MDENEEAGAHVGALDHGASDVDNVDDGLCVIVL